MGKTILYIAVSLDGYIAGPNEDLSWLNPKNDINSTPPDEPKDSNPYEFDAFFKNVGAIIIGRDTYDLEMRMGWGSAHNVPKFIVTSRPPHPDAKSDDFFLNDDIEMVLKKAKESTDKTVWVEGGGKLAQEFIKRDLLDEAIIFIAPVLLGKGIPLFGDLDEYKYWKLERQRSYGKGMVQLEYSIPKK